MAEKKRTPAKKRASSSQRKKTAVSPKSNIVKMNTPKRFGDSIYDEIAMILCILISVLVLLGLCTGFMGGFGEFINSFLKGIFGAGAFILPVTVIAFCIWAMASRDTSFAYGKIAGIVLIIINVSTLFHLITQGGLPKYSGVNFWGQVGYFYKDATGVSGGIIGGLFAWGLYSLLGRGSYLVVIVFLIIGIMLSTGKSLFTAVFSFFDLVDEKKRENEARIKVRADSIRQKEEKRARKEEEAQLKRQRRYEVAERSYDMPPIKSIKPKKGFFNITINGDEGLDNSLPPLNAVVFEKKSEPKKEEEPKEAYDFKKDAEDDWQYSGEKFIEVLGAVNDNSDDDEVVFEMPLRENEENNFEEETEPITDVPYSEPEINISFDEEEESKNGEKIEKIENIENTEESSFAEEEIEFGGASDGKLLEGILNEDDTQTPKAEEKPASLPKTEPAPLPKEQVEAELLEEEEEEDVKYEFPPIDLLGKAPQGQHGENKSEMLANAKKLEETLHSFGVEAKVNQINKGPTVTRYELTPNQGVKVSKIVNLADDIALNLAATGIRIEAPIPGKAAVGIEVPNKEPQSVYLRSVIESDTFKKAASKLTFALGEDIAGNPVVTDIAKMPHLLIAGATGSGKSVCINTLITSILYKADPEEVKLLLIDPKVVELSVYNGVPHLLIPVVTDPKKAAGALNWAAREMLGRYNLFAEHNVRDMKGYNEMKREKDETDLMPQIVIVIDELADLMMAAPGDVEDSICRLAQMARAAGIHLIIATQRPSVDVITGLIKANIPSRLAFAVSSGIDSRTILDTVGAEKLLGKGDMLFYPVGMSKPVRLQGAFVTDKEVENIVDFVKQGKKAKYSSTVMESISSPSGGADEGEEKDEHFDKAVDLVVEKEKASISMLQRQFRIGYNRAANLMDSLEANGIVGPEEGSKPRRVLITKEELLEMRKPKSEE